MLTENILTNNFKEKSLMSIDRSFKVKGALSRHRNVLKRAERIEILKDEERWSEGDSLLGLSKVAHRKTSAGKN